VDIIYLAAGEGKRAKLGYPKQLARLGGKPIAVHALERFAQFPEVDKVIVPCPAGSEDDFAELFEQYGVQAVCITGGKTRQQSTRNALDHVTSDYVLVHEAVRPFASAHLIRRVINSVGPTVTPWLPSLASVVGSWGTYLNREWVGQVQMPQKFQTALLRLAHKKADGTSDYTDDSYLVWAETGAFPELLQGEEENIKITTPLDLILAEAIYNARYAAE